MRVLPLANAPLNGTVCACTVLMWFCMGVKLRLSLRDEHRLNVFQNRVLRRIFRLKKDEVTGAS